MILLIVSPPSSSTHILLSAAHEIVNGLSGKVEHIHLSTLDVLKESWLKRGSNHLVMFLDRPDADLANMLSRVPLPIVFLAEDPVESARFLMAKHKLGAEEAVRLAASSYASIQKVVCAAHNLLCIRPEQCRNRADAIEHLQYFLEIDSTEKVQRAEDTAGSLVQASFGPAGDSHSLTALAEALLPFRGLAQLQRARRIPFPTGLFMITDPLGDYYHGADLPLVGPARILLYGPYLHLPAGRWRIQIRFEVVENLSGNVIKFEALSGHEVIAHAVGPLPAKGTFVAKIEEAFSEPHEPVQIRISIQEGAIEGRFTLLEAEALHIADEL